MDVPPAVEIECPNGHRFTVTMSDLRAQREPVYLDPQTETAGPLVRRRVRCPACGNYVIVTLPRGWLGDE